jgi:uncharacterized BrkB/YihY/UPF0761 family membrane protein
VNLQVSDTKEIHITVKYIYGKHPGRKEHRNFLMRSLSLIFLIFLIFVAMLYTAIGIRFSTTRKRHIHLALFFLTGMFTGIIGGFTVIYNLTITRHVVIFDIAWSRWLLVTLLAIIFGGLLSIIVLLRIWRK